jgi:DNA-binding SARP family transcriptional activator
MLRLHLFGALSFSLADAHNGTFAEPVHLGGRSGSLLAYLALARGRYFSRSELVSALWADQSDAVSSGTFNTVLWRLRKTVERPPLAHGELIACDRGGAVGLHPQARIELDVEQFARRVLPALAKPIERLNEQDIEALRDGVELYTADILTDIDDEWALREREKHRRHYLNALGRLTDLCAMAGDHGAAIRYAQAILDNDALREDVHRELMRLFMKSGQRALALRQFEICRTVLKRELAIQPMPETVALYQAIADPAVMGLDAAAAHRRDEAPARSVIGGLVSRNERAMSARELVEAARAHLAKAEEQLQLALPFL